MSGDDKLKRMNMWARMRRNFVKWWQVFYIPIQRFVMKDSPKVDREEYLEQQRKQQEEELAAQEAAKQKVLQDLTAKAEEGVAAKKAAQEEEQKEEQKEEEFDLLAADDSTLSADELAAKEILARLQAEADADAAKKQAEIDAAREHIENSENSAYNAATHSFSGNYGKGPMDEATADAVADILNHSGNDVEAMVASIKSGEL